MKQLVLKTMVLLSLIVSFSDVQATCISGNCINGKGIYLFRDGSKYSGTFLQSKPHGTGSYYHRDGSVYTGGFSNGERHGNGKLEFRSKDIYIGAFANGVISGKGKMTYRNGDVYLGDWEKGKSSGKGRYTFANGNVYEGDFMDGQFTGVGKLTRVDGSYYDGQWKHNKKNGTGTAFRKGKHMIQRYDMDVLKEEEPYDTVVHSNQVSNPAELTTALPDCNSVYCHMVKGIYKYGDGSVYKGDFINGEGEGQGTCVYAGGDKYEGGWKNHAPHGKGTMFFSTGKVYAAMWDNGVPKQKIIVPENKTGIAVQTSSPPAKTSAGSKNDDGKTSIYALVIGVATYNHMPSLKYTDDDAYQLYAFLKSPEGGAIPDDNIKIMIDDAVTYQSVLQEIRLLAQKADAGDVVMLYMSGHGLDGAYVPSDFDGYKNQVPYDDILQLLNNSPAKHKLFITDACHSGSMTVAARTPLNIALENFYSAYKTINGGTAIMMSSKKEEVSLEYGGLRQGVFSHFLIKGLKGQADANGDKLITVTELYDYVSSNVKSYTASAQNPAIMGDYDKDMPVGLRR